MDFLRWGSLVPLPQAESEWGNRSEPDFSGGKSYEIVEAAEGFLTARENLDREFCLDSDDFESAISRPLRFHFMSCTHWPACPYTFHGQVPHILVHSDPSFSSPSRDGEEVI